MTVALCLASIVLVSTLAYTLQFTAATLTMGRELSDSPSTTGFQDAITPPWLTNLALVMYAAIACTIGAGWWFKGLVGGVLVLVSIFIGTMFLKQILPRPDSEHYQVLILRSMSRRYADFVRDGDTARAEAMKALLGRADVDPDASRGA